jgi:transposase
MEITFATARLAKLCNDRQKAIREWGPQVGPNVIGVVGRLAEAPDLAAAAAAKHLRIHPLQQGRRKSRGHYSADASKRMRLILVPIADGQTIRRPDGTPEWESVRVIEIVEVEDTHDEGHKG